METWSFAERRFRGVKGGGDRLGIGAIQVLEG